MVLKCWVLHIKLLLYRKVKAMLSVCVHVCGPDKWHNKWRSKIGLFGSTSSCVFSWELRCVYSHKTSYIIINLSKPTAIYILILYGCMMMIYNTNISQYIYIHIYYIVIHLLLCNIIYTKSLVFKRVRESVTLLLDTIHNHHQHGSECQGSTFTFVVANSGM